MRPYFKFREFSLDRENIRTRKRVSNWEKLYVQELRNIYENKKKLKVDLSFRDKIISQ
jgi:hypothetical protein